MPTFPDTVSKLNWKNTAPLLAAIFAFVLIAACSSDDPATPTPLPTATIAAPTATVAAPTATSAPPSPTPEPTVDPVFARFADVPNIVDPTNFGWPRSVDTNIGRIEIAAQPERIYSLSLGHAEIIAALRGGEVLVATASFFKDPGTSAAHAEFAGSPNAGSDPEEIIGLNPQLVIASAFTPAALIDQLNGVGVTVIRADLEDSALGNVPNILLLGYMLGAEERAVELADQVTSRVEMIASKTDGVQQPRVLAMSRFSDIFVAGGGSTEGGIIEAAGGINVAAEDGISGHQTVGIEGIAALSPEIILLTQPEESALAFAEELYADPALAEVPAVQNRMILYADPTFYTTLSHWNVRGIEESAKVFYPDLFGSETFAPFTHP